MPTADEGCVVAPAATSQEPKKTRRLVRALFRRLVRGMMVLAFCLAVGAAALVIGWLTSLNGLPDIGEPFDVREFRTFRVADDQNAFIFLRRASEKLTPAPATVGGERCGPERFEVFVVHREPHVARVGRGEWRGARTVSEGG